MKIAFLTAGGIAPCLSSSIGALIEQYAKSKADAEMVGYLNGYRGLLLGQSIEFPDSIKNNFSTLYEYGGSPIGNSRVKLTNVDDCIGKGYVKEGEDPLKVAAEQLKKDKVDILHTIGGDDTNTMAAQLSKYLKNNGYDLTVVGLPKTVDNDVYPIAQTLGAWTAAEQGAVFFENIVNENTNMIDLDKHFLAKVREHRNGIVHNIQFAVSTNISKGESICQCSARRGAAVLRAHDGFAI